MRTIISVLFYILYASTIMAQNQDAELKGLFNNMLTSYNKASNLSFDLTYRFSEESNPSVYLDSMKGSFKLEGDNYKYVIDSTETIKNRDYVVLLFKEDLIMYLSKSSQAMNGNPMQFIDSALLNYVQSSSVRKDGNHIELQLDLVEGMPYKKITYLLDASTWYVIKAQCVVTAEQLYDPSVRSLIEGNAFAIIEVVMDNYRENSFDKSELDVGKYFKKDEKGFSVLAPYQSYKLFIGSPTL